MKKIILGIIGLLLVVVGGLIIKSKFFPAGLDKTTVAEGDLTPIATASSQPVRLIIPSLDLKAKIIPLGTTATGEFAAPAQEMRVGWYLGSDYPGTNQPESTILLDGHLTDSQGQPAIFANLHQLKKGEEMAIEREDGEVFTYLVREIESKDTEEIDMSALMTPPAPSAETVTIITCAGDFNPQTQTYTRRLIVQGRRLGD
jgi:LPXTG-site transpeptidase (sortase) family protein